MTLPSALFCRIWSPVLTQKTRNSLPLVAHIRCLKVAVIGSGPAGFYLTQQLLKSSRVSSIDLFEKFPVPFGLVRYGVAPDHPEVKNVEHSFTKTAESDRVSFLGNVNIGPDVSLQEIRQAYNAVVLCYGSARDRSLGIPGEDLSNVISARRFVGWYNGVPQDQSLDVNLDTDTCIIIGHGNVALDCARILLTPVDNGLGKTDITSHASLKLKSSRVKNVQVIGRRGPLQVAFTIKELRELTKIPGCHTLIDPKEVSFVSLKDLQSFHRSRKRLTELIVNISKSNPRDLSEKRCVIDFRMIPVSIESKNTQLNVDFVVNRLEDAMNEKSKVIATNEKITKTAGLVIKSIGYTTIALDSSIPLDEKRGCIRNEGGKVLDSGDGLYCSGWAATGPSGVLLGTMNVSFEVAKRILKDAETGNIDTSEKPGGDYIRSLLKERNVQFVSFDDWKKIDAKERELGQLQGKPREKFVSIPDFVAAVQEKSNGDAQ